MTDRAQFEALLEALINEDQETAKEIFHNIVVGKSREIYEELLSEDFDVDESCDEKEEESVEEAFDFSDDEDSEGEEESDEESDEDSEDDEEMGSLDDVDSDKEESDDLEDRVLDLEDALEELKAEFEELLAGEEEEPEHSDMFGNEEEPVSDMGDELDAEFGADEEEQDEEFQQFMEYVNKVALPKHDGSNSVKTKSAIAGKNDMGGTTANIAKSFSTTKGGTTGGLLNPATKLQDAGNVNVPGNTKAPKLSPATKSVAEKSANDKSLVGGK